MWAWKTFVLCPQYSPAHIMCFIWTLHPGFFLERSPFLVGSFIGPVVFTRVPSAFKNSCKLRWWKREEEKNQTGEQTFLLCSLIASPAFQSLEHLGWSLALSRPPLWHLTHICPFPKQLRLRNTSLDPLVFLQLDETDLTTVRIRESTPTFQSSWRVSSLIVLNH